MKAEQQSTVVETKRAPHPGGRPSRYDPAFCETVIACGERGASVIEMAYELGVGRTTVERDWPAAHPEFSQAMERARIASQVWWEKKGRDGMERPGFNAAIWSRSMAARFPADWRERQEHEHSGLGGGAIAHRIELVGVLPLGKQPE